MRMLTEAMVPYFPLAMILLSFLTIFKLFSIKRPQLPPGPFAWPIVGNLFQMGNTPLHITLAKLAQVHGPLMSLRLGARLLIVASSPAAAAQILKDHDSILSGRYVQQPVLVKDSKLHNLSAGFCSRCDDNWKSIRALYKAELFSAKALKSQAELRANKVMEMVSYLASKEGQVVKIKEIVFATALNILSNVTLSMDFVDYEDNGVGTGLRENIRKFAEEGVVPQLADLFPILGGCDIQNMYKKLMDIFERMCASWEDTLGVKRMRKKVDAAGPADFTDALISKGYSDEQINALLQEIFGAGTESTSGTTEWALTELIRNQEVMQKLRDELTTVIGNDKVRESYLPHLTYLEACVKETLRLHPPGPLLLPHKAIETCEVMGFTIPKDTQIFVNMWAIGRDQDIWKDPMSFKPERFLVSKLDYKGQNFEYFPFGSGRRICPGQPLASQVVPLILATLIYTFDWFLPENMTPEMIDLTEVLDVTMRKAKTLCVIPMQRKQLIT